MHTVLFAARIMLGGFLMFKGFTHFTKAVTMRKGGNLIVYDLPATGAILMGGTLLLSGVCIMCGISPFLGLVWTGAHAFTRAGAPDVTPRPVECTQRETKAAFDAPGREPEEEIFDAIHTP